MLQNLEGASLGQGDEGQGGDPQQQGPGEGPATGVFEGDTTEKLGLGGFPGAPTEEDELRTQCSSSVSNPQHSWGEPNKPRYDHQLFEERSPHMDHGSENVSLVERLNNKRKLKHWIRRLRRKECTFVN